MSPMLTFRVKRRHPQKQRHRQLPRALPHLTAHKTSAPPIRSPACLARNDCATLPSRSTPRTKASVDDVCLALRGRNKKVEHTPFIVVGKSIPMRDWRRARDVATGVATCTGESFVAICIIWASLFKPRAVGVAPEVAPEEGAEEKDAVDETAVAGLVGNESGHGVDSGTEEKDEGEGGGAGEGSNLLASEGGGATLNPDTIDAQWSLGLSRRAIPRLLQQLTTMFVITVTLVLVWEGVKGVWMLVGSKRVLMLAGATQDSTATLADSHGLHAEQKLYKSQGSHGPSIPSAVGGRLKAENHMIFLVLP